MPQEDPKQQAARLTRAVESLELERRRLKYRLDTSEAHFAWQWCEERNLDAANSFSMDFYISPNSVTRHIEKVYLRIQVMPYIFWTVGGGTTGATAAGCTVTINGTNRTVALTGGATFGADQDELDITQYMTATGYNTITIGSSGLGRIRATVYASLYLNSR